MEAFPEAKVVLSVRNPQTWYKSVYDTIYNFHIFREDTAMCLFGHLTGYMRNMKCAHEVSLHPPKVGFPYHDMLIILVDFRVINEIPAKSGGIFCLLKPSFSE